MGQYGNQVSYPDLEPTAHTPQTPYTPQHPYPGQPPYYQQQYHTPPPGFPTQPRRAFSAFKAGAFPIWDVLVGSFQALFLLFFCFGWYAFHAAGENWEYDYGYRGLKIVVSGTISPPGVIGLVLAITLFFVALFFIFNRNVNVVSVTGRQTAFVYVTLAVLILVFVLIAIAVNGVYMSDWFNQEIKKALLENDASLGLNWSYFVCLAIAVLNLPAAFLKFMERE